MPDGLVSGGPVIMEQWVVYQRPKDFPSNYVARKWLIRRGGIEATASVMVCRTIDRLRRELAGRGLTCLDRDPEDDPSIVEVWL